MVALDIDERRRQILDEDARHCLVLGGPGSGKTTLALAKAYRHLQGHFRNGQTALFLSFSRAAVTRINQAAEKELRNLPDSIAIQTFHSFFWQIIQAHGYLLGLPRNVRVVTSHEEASLREGIRETDAGWPAWEKRRREMAENEGRICFALFAPLAAQLLAGSKRLRHRYSHRYPLILVDEAQDTGRDQWACVEKLGERSQVVCLADPDQMIFANLPGAGVSKARIAGIRKVFAPLEVDLGRDNHRNAHTDILGFSRDIYLRKPPRSYKNVTVRLFHPQAESRDSAIRGSLGQLLKILKGDGHGPIESVAILTTYTSGVAIVSSALQKGKPIPHHVLFDESFALLSARAAAFLLEPAAGEPRLAAAELLELVGKAYAAKGTQSARTIRDRCAAYAQRMRQGETLTYKPAEAALAAVSAARAKTMEGDPRRDWSAVKRILRGAGHEMFEEAAKHLDYLVAFARGKRIAEGLGDAWMAHGAYIRAREVLDAALAQDQLLSGISDNGGIHVMNVHKSKGKQFDGVVLYRQQHHSPFTWRDETEPFPEGRKLLHMAAMRAKRHVLILSEAFPACPILAAHGLM